MKKLFREELMWAAGLFEGEGCLGVRLWKGTPSIPTLQLASTDEDVVRRFHAAVGVGNFNGPYQYGTDKDGVAKKPYWQWSALGYERAQAVIALLWEGLGVRRRARAKEVLMLTRVDRRHEFSGRYR